MPGLRISAAVEGIVDEAVVARLINHVGCVCGDVYGKRGKSWLRNKAAAYNRAANHAPWLVLVDLDRDAPCAAELVRAWLPKLAPRLCFRVAIQEVEAWLLADAAGLASFLGIAASRVPRDVESLADPKQEMVKLAGISRRRDIRDDMIPRQGSGRNVGPAYSSRLIEFALDHWQPDRAADRSDSLRRALASLERLAD